jgi:four helix bundle protein
LVRGSLFLVAERGGETKNKEQRTKNKEQRTKNKERGTQNMKITRFEDIEGWQLARELTKRVYGVAMRGAFAKDFGLRDQITRASGSAMHNIAEGFDGGSNAEFVKFLRYSQRSCLEVQSQLYVALDLAYITLEEFDGIYNQVALAHAKVGGFIRYLLSAPNPR